MTDLETATQAIKTNSIWLEDAFCREQRQNNAYTLFAALAGLSRHLNDSFTETQLQHLDEVITAFCAAAAEAWLAEPMNAPVGFVKTFCQEKNCA